jgi:hypothetical protein
MGLDSGADETLGSHQLELYPGLPAPLGLALPEPSELVTALAELAIKASAKWRDGSLAPSVVHPFHAVFGAVTLFMLAVCPVLDGVARRALEQTRPALDVTDAEYERWEYVDAP